MAGCFDGMQESLGARCVTGGAAARYPPSVCAQLQVSCSQHLTDSGHGQDIAKKKRMVRHVATHTCSYARWMTLFLPGIADLALPTEARTLGGYRTAK